MYDRWTCDNQSMDFKFIDANHHKPTIVQVQIMFKHAFFTSIPPSLPSIFSISKLPFTCYFIELFFFICRYMGGDQSNIKNQQQNELVELDISEADKALVQRSKHKPSPLYAKLAKQAPTLLKIVDQTKQRESKGIKFSKNAQSTQVLPLYQMVAAPSIFYRGGWQNGKQHGKGEVFTKSGIYFIGQFVYGSAECNDGLVIFPDGSFYRGAFIDNQFQGNGKFQSAYNETTYEGHWVQNRPHGQGKESYKDKSYYKGEWVAGVKQGTGYFNWGNGKVYNGGFENGEMHGEGELFYPGTRSKFKGRFEHGEKVAGELATEYGRYEGKFLYGEMHDPYGKFIWHDGKTYEGGFEFGQMHGRGKLTLDNGNVINGRWERGENVVIENLIN